MSSDLAGSREPTDAQLIKLAGVIGEDALEALQGGRAVLRIWRRTNPHNWYVEDSQGDMPWHSAEGADRHLPDLRCFELVEESPDTISASFPGRDAGRPERSTYRLCGIVGGTDG